MLTNAYTNKPMHAGPTPFAYAARAWWELLFFKLHAYSNKSSLTTAYYHKPASHAAKAYLIVERERRDEGKSSLLGI